MPLPVIKAFGILKKCSAKVNTHFGLEQHIGTMLATQRTQS